MHDIAVYPTTVVLYISPSSFHAVSCVGLPANSSCPQIFSKFIFKKHKVELNVKT